MGGRVALEDAVWWAGKSQGEMLPGAPGAEELADGGTLKNTFNGQEEELAEEGAGAGGFLSGWMPSRKCGSQG